MGPPVEGEARPRLRLLRWRKVQKGFVVGFADIELPAGLKIVDVMIVAKDGKTWANLPSKLRVRIAEGRPVVELGADGKPVYDTLLSWRTRELAEAFSQRVIEVLSSEHPGDIPRVVDGS